MIGTALPADRVNNLELQVSGLLTRVAALETADVALDTRLDAAEASLTALLAAGTAWEPDYTFNALARTPTASTGRYLQHGKLAIVSYEWTPQNTESGSPVTLINLPLAIRTGFPGQFLCSHNAVSYRCLLIPGGTTGIFRELANANAMPLNNAANVSGILVYETT